MNLKLGGNTVTLFERVFGGNDYNYARTVAAIDEAIAAYGESEPVSFPGTAYSLPCYYGVTGVKITTRHGHHQVQDDPQQPPPRRL